MRRIFELPFVRSITALGVRNVERDEIDAMRELGVRWAPTLDLIERGSADVVRELVPPSRARSTSRSTSTSSTSP